MNPEDLHRLVTTQMPFGKYKGRLIADLPGHYLNWFAREGFPPGQIGRLLALLQELAKQTERLEKAQQSLAATATKKAAEDVRIATNKIAAAKGKLEELKSTELKPRDSRIYPGWYAPVMIMENGRRVVKPMRYQCRPAGKPAFYD